MPDQIPTRAEENENDEVDYKQRLIDALEAEIRRLRPRLNEAERLLREVASGYSIGSSPLLEEIRRFVGVDNQA